MALPLAAIQAGVGGVQAIAGAVQSISAANDTKRYLSQRKAYQTPEELYRILQATEQAAQGGYDPFTLDYLTSEIDRAYADSAGDINRNGGDPNMIADLFQKRMQGIM